MIADILKVAILIVYVEARLTVVPNYTKVDPGGNVTLICSTGNSITELHWYHYPLNGEPKSVCEDKLQGSYAGRFQCKPDYATVTMNLLITSVRKSDEGRYECQDQRGNGSRLSAELSVLENCPPSYDNCTGKEAEFCLGNGRCCERYSTASLLCVCSPGHYGKHCQYSVADLDISSRSIRGIYACPTVFTDCSEVYADYCFGHGQCCTDTNTIERSCSCHRGYFGGQCDGFDLNRVADKQSRISYLIEIPSDEAVEQNQPASFNCSTSSSNPFEEIYWFHYPVNTKSTEVRKQVYGSNGVLSPYKNRFIMERKGNLCSLIIPHANEEDAGRYECVDKNGEGNRSSAELIVLGDVTKSSNIFSVSGEVIGPNDCGVEPDELRFSCTVNFFGNIGPQLEWTKKGFDEPISDGVACNNFTSNVTCQLTTKANINGACYVCRTKKSSLNQYSLVTVGAEKVLYVLNNFVVSETARGETVRCLPSSSISERCNYSWKWFGDKREVTLIQNESDLILKEPGLYTCETECAFKGKLCTVVGSLFHVSQECHDSQTSYGPYVLNAVLIVFSIMTTAIIVYLTCFKAKRKMVSNLNVSPGEVAEMRVSQYYEVLPYASTGEEGLPYDVPYISSDGYYAIKESANYDVILNQPAPKAPSPYLVITEDVVIEDVVTETVSPEVSSPNVEVIEDASTKVPPFCLENI